MAFKSRSRRATVAVVACAVSLLTGLGTEPAGATSSSWCGTVVASGGYCSGNLSGGYGTTWRYTSNTYPGAGSIDYMWAGMNQYYAGSYYAYDYGIGAYNTTFVNVCYTGTSGHNNYGVIFQLEASGAGHTLVGRNDDSPNHTGCIPAYGV